MNTVLNSIKFSHLEEFAGVNSSCFVCFRDVHYAILLC